MRAGAQLPLPMDATINRKIILHMTHPNPNNLRRTGLHPSAGAPDSTLHSNTVTGQGAKRVNILVVGASGFLGAHVYRRLLEEGENVLGTCGRHHRPGLQTIDLLDTQVTTSFLNSLRTEPDVIIWCAKRNRENDDEQALNETGLRDLARSVPDTTRLIFVSTDGVLPGTGGPHGEEVTPSPFSSDSSIARYTNGKLWAERWLQSDSPLAHTTTIVRTGMIYGRAVSGEWDTRTAAVLKDFASGEAFSRADNLLRTFVHVEELASALCELASIDCIPSILHAGPEKGESHYTFAGAIARAWSLPMHLLRPHRVPPEDVKEREVRLDTRLNTSLLRSKLATPFRSVDEMFTLLARQTDCGIGSRSSTRG